ncbi:GNAT family N-acetyltransferase [Marivirga salinae]|uniref:GNAT family N-acetyltransferase n=1 Tax=Marivirga salinarum TaxID=3059078 RepID=A0AA51N905_9BACT|nr:GNAT family N-acetyltransferase [Marivirga sp. BDSF4-3]WMN10813.1 GNAT family N-acetyltransferase [Marivirga sp. BDSF4-3]
MRQNYQISEQFPSREEEEALNFPLFARKEYWLLHMEVDVLVPITIKNHQNQIIAFWCFSRIKNRLITPINAPFFTPFSHDFDKDGVLILTVINYCKTKYNLSIQMTLKSDLEIHKFQNSIPTLNIKKVEIGSQLSIINDSFLQQIQKKRKRRKLQSLFSDNTFEIKEVNINEWEEVYEQNLSWRKEKGHQNFMSKKEMLKAKLQFPKSYHAFLLKKDQDLIGTAFFLRVDQNLIYVYSLITSPAIDSEEPSLLLWKAIYDFANEKNISTVDMGTSMLADGSINKSLARYKKFIGGSHYKKYTIEC